MKKLVLNQREKVKKIKILRPSRLKCESHKYHFKKAKSIKAKKAKK
jgi:hypothetical protein